MADLLLAISASTGLPGAAIDAPTMSAKNSPIQFRIVRQREDLDIDFSWIREISLHSSAFADDFNPILQIDLQIRRLLDVMAAAIDTRDDV